jgi:hypothetical protein
VRLLAIFTPFFQAFEGHNPVFAVGLDVLT